MFTAPQRRMAAAWTVSAAAVVLAAPLLVASFFDTARTSCWALLVAAVWAVAGAGICALCEHRPTTMLPHGRSVALASAAGFVFAGVSLAGGLGLHSMPWSRSSVEGPVQLTVGADPYVILLVALLAGAGEEMFFRIGLPRLLTGRARWIIPTVAYAAVTLATGSLALVAMAILLGLMASWVVLRTGRGYTAVIVHGLWTMVMVGLFPTMVA